MSVIEFRYMDDSSGERLKCEACNRLAPLTMFKGGLPLRNLRLCERCRSARCPICASGPNLYCLEAHVAAARDALDLKAKALRQDSAEVDAYEIAALKLTGQLDGDA